MAQEIILLISQFFHNLFQVHFSLLTYTVRKSCSPDREQPERRQDMKYRHEWKHEISYVDQLTLQTRLAAVMKKYPHAVDGKYQVRSVYFDTPADKALREKIDGVNSREKFRIRFYNGDTSFITLEKKSKMNGLCAKQSCSISKEEAQRIVDMEGMMKDYLVYQMMMPTVIPTSSIMRKPIYQNPIKID